MAMMPETRDALARYDEWLARTMKSPDAIAVQTRRLERATRSVGRRLRNMLFGAFAVVLAAFLYGNLVAPLGFLGLVVTFLAVLCVMVLLSSWPREPEPVLEKLPEVPLKALPAQVETWLEGQRRALPAPAVREIDRVMAQLDQLSPQLARLDPASPMAEDARRLVGDHLPRLVKSYAEVPATHRGSAEATGHFREGLKVVGQEIDRLTTTIARDSLAALEVEGRFLETRYKGTDKVEE
jgi:hypothetical protein